jgi:hypothetical protein
MGSGAGGAQAHGVERGPADRRVRPAFRAIVGMMPVQGPFLQEAATIGLHSLDFFAARLFEESGLGSVTAVEELFWGDAGIGLSLVGSTLAAVAVVANGTPGQTGEWRPQMFGTPGEVKLGAFCSSGPGAIADALSRRGNHRQPGAA